LGLFVFFEHRSGSVLTFERRIIAQIVLADTWNHAMLQVFLPEAQLSVFILLFHIRFGYTQLIASRNRMSNWNHKNRLRKLSVKTPTYWN